MPEEVRAAVEVRDASRRPRDPSVRVLVGLHVVGAPQGLGSGRAHRVDSRRLSSAIAVVVAERADPHAATCFVKADGGTVLEHDVEGDVELVLGDLVWPRPGRRPLGLGQERGSSLAIARNRSAASEPVSATFVSASAQRSY